MPSLSNKVGIRFNFICGIAIFLAAFLLFQVELIIAKYILPWFGGTPSVWTTCMLFFQVFLLAGYLYAHLLSTHLQVQSQERVHIFLLGISCVLIAGLAFFWSSPLTPGAAWKPEGDAEPVYQIIRLLVISVGMPFFLLAATIIIGGACILHAQPQVAGSVARFRSFFGVVSVYKEGYNLILKHGKTIHGWQIQDGIYDPTPTCYYATNTGIGIFLRNHYKQKMSGPESDLRVGIVGPGTGTLAAYGRSQDYYRFYEIDHKIASISQGPHAMFTFLQLSAAKTEVVLGDGRLLLEREAKRGDFGRFDILVLDAFSSDSIPTHLLTREAMEVYLSHLRGTDSVIAFHITNRLLDPSPVLLGLSREFGMDILIVDNSKGNISLESRWVFLSRDTEALSLPQWERFALRPFERAQSILWTDNYSNLFQIVMNWTGL
ncbi:MAG: NADH-quinone oxidoreductase subunit A [Deltaproteobacteria bacterium]|nr:NADH-quinone oxidoreductase subunit A [Deltaproteobacteria bacterium]